MPGFLSSRPSGVSHAPHPQNSVVPPPPLGPRGEKHSLAGGRSGTQVYYNPLRRPNTSSCHRPLHVWPVATIRPLHVLPVATDRYMSCQLPQTATCLASCHRTLHVLPVATYRCMPCQLQQTAAWLATSTCQCYTFKSPLPALICHTQKYVKECLSVKHCCLHRLQPGSYGILMSTARYCVLPV